MLDRITAVLLAAGGARRFGGDKLLYRLPDGRSIGRAAAESLLAVVPRTIAVLRPDDAELAEQLAAAGCRIIRNPEHELGMGASLACGVRASADASGWLIALADMPFIRPRTVQAVCGQLRAGRDLVAPVFAGRRGHPVGIGRRFKGELAELRGDQGARELLRHHALDLLPCDDPGICTDIDRPEDLLPTQQKARP